MDVFAIMKKINTYIEERLVLSKNKKDIFSTIEPSQGCYNTIAIQNALIEYSKQTNKSYDLSTIYNELPIYDHGKTEYEVQDITASERYIWLGVINKENGKLNEFNFVSLELLATILGKHSIRKGFAVINYIVDDIENILN